MTHDFKFFEADIMRRLLSLMLLCWLGAVNAAENEALEMPPKLEPAPAEDWPDIPAPVRSGEVMPPDVSAPADKSAKDSHQQPVEVESTETHATPIPEQPDLPTQVHSGEQMEPDITITRKGNETVQEFRRNGKLYMVKIKPDVGPAYYLIDQNGDGVMDIRRSDLEKGGNVNQWTIMEWQ